MLASGFSNINTLGHWRRFSKGLGVGYMATIALLALLTSGGGALAQQPADSEPVLTPSIKPFMKFDLRAPGRDEPRRGFPLFYQDRSTVPVALELCTKH